MRISDWSSDVCSSDLHSTDRRNFLGLMAAGATAVVGAPVSARQVRSKFPPDVGSKFYADGRVHPFPGNTVICHVPQQGEHSGCFNALLDIYREAPAHPFVRKITRSEEHTSELQSLMRTSYAVFCLKKKKNRKHNYMST